MGQIMAKYLLDTNAVIDALNQGFKFPNNEYFISVITEIELFSYPHLSKEDKENLKIAIRSFESIELTSNIKEKTIKIRQQSRIKLPDSIIIASAISKNAILVTADKQLVNSQIIKTISLYELK
ncbi:MAG: PIN domain-containing protein [Deltaproteobacteria bacterium HGW-Deltaproteobacteria-24]|jgi:predicted nucleic acid-binding protein|nr:MAG: PIN domain-containing protein [Deltaproteobacteria bacterium HGW-Deltaproteobacteria-24]